METPVSTPWTAVIGLGANLGEARQTLREAVAALGGLPAARLIGLSSLYASAPVDAQGPDFLNAAALLETTRAPLDLLDALQALELAHGRLRPYRNAPRTLDLDLLLGETVDGALLRIEHPRLSLPHPRWDQRAFVLRPLAELRPARVPAAALAGVQDQAIRIAESGSSWGLA
ncbi:2-amino-4-hydroxy-6-hydroxymethyldihydropteridine diphosphokinase [Piscinibacter sp. Jin2]|uniref:2-amino-4-hydroxy-6-hydroxymethyldihydropteridine pyrophosphokinase n=1 Tax=Aquariibacter lacus TaxID=2801332 RepID=A0A9X0XBW3_9BURK|nr:2-amino-4-hydroxy-6-hydroxymethyldihydropteridine diphosphokinase [Piscinibacter lacus]MBL0719367.1 2-amino-4-hydroxy-6-hydroxymethyldihydropteridine diphosphokinase [Piscinibacter lacus]